jgi:hypothetical protein
LCRRKKGDYLHAGEPEQPFIERLTEFKEWLLRRPEKRIAVVAHWGAIYGLTGESYIYIHIYMKLVSHGVFQYSECVRMRQRERERERGRENDRQTDNHQWKRERE